MFTVINRSPYLIINTTGPGSYVSNNGQMSGMVRYSCSTQMLEVYDGCSWIPQNNSTVINTSAELDNVVQWAKEKMHEENRLNELAKTNESVRIALKNVKVAQEQLHLIQILSEDYKPTQNS